MRSVFLGVERLQLFGTSMAVASQSSYWGACSSISYECLEVDTEQSGECGVSYPQHESPRYVVELLVTCKLDANIAKLNPDD